MAGGISFASRSMSTSDWAWCNLRTIGWGGSTRRIFKANCVTKRSNSRSSLGAGSSRISPARRPPKRSRCKFPKASRFLRLPRTNCAETREDAVDDETRVDLADSSRPRVEMGRPGPGVAGGQSFAASRTI